MAGPVGLSLGMNLGVRDLWETELSQGPVGLSLGMSLGARDLW